jgi:uncharacterized protein YbjT (DUF2867 family)
MTALVTGATGHVGRHVVSGLLSAGVEVRAVSRAPEKAGLPAAAEIVQGDMTQPDSLRAALQDVDRMYLFPVPETATAVVQLAKAAGVRRIVTLSSVAASYPAGDMSGDHHRVVEQAVEASGLSWTHLRPGEFMSNSLNWVPSIRDERVVREPYGTATSAMVHEADIADVAVAALLEDGHAGAKYRLTGRERLTKTERVAIIGDVLGWDITFEVGGARCRHRLADPAAEGRRGRGADHGAGNRPACPHLRGVGCRPPGGFPARLTGSRRFLLVTERPAPPERPRPTLSSSSAGRPRR